jgi:hypothetical protein
MPPFLKNRVFKAKKTLSQPKSLFTTKAQSGARWGQKQQSASPPIPRLLPVRGHGELLCLEWYIKFFLGVHFADNLA